MKKIPDHLEEGECITFRAEILVPGGWTSLQGPNNSSSLESAEEAHTLINRVSFACQSRVVMVKETVIA